MPAPPNDDPPRPAAPVTWRERNELLSGGAPAVGSTRLAGSAAVVAVLAVVAVVLVVLLRRPDGPPPELSLPVAGGADDPAASTTTTAADVFVHAAGAVLRPGVYRVPAGARVSDLVDAAGGPMPDADLDRLNLAAAVTDGQQVYVPRVGEAPPAGAGVGGSPASPAGPIDLNTATAADLEELPGVGPATAAAIVAYRDDHGPFRSVEQLLEVRGIGEAKLDALRDLVVV